MNDEKLTKSIKIRVNESEFSDLNIKKEKSIFKIIDD